MKRIVLFSILALIVSAFTFSAQAKKKEKYEFRYEIAPVGVGTQGSALIKVFSYAKKEKDALELAKPNAVHGVLFKGVAALSNQYARVPAQKAMVTDVNAETTYADYFKDFFKDGGKYAKYVNFVNNGVPAPGDIIKVGKEYKIGVRVSVAKDALRKEMEAAGIVKALSSGF